MPRTLPSGVRQSMPDWFDATANNVLAATGRPPATVRFFRVSSTNPSLFTANLTAGLATADQSDLDVVAAQEVGGLLAERTAEGASARSAHGTLDVTVGDLPGGDGSQRNIGHLTAFGSTIMGYLLASGASRDLQADNPEDGANAAVETVRETIRQLSTFGRRRDDGYRLSVHFTDETRPARDEGQAHRLIKTLCEYQARLFIRGQEYDLRRPQDKQIVAMLVGMAATERDLTVGRTVRGKTSLLVVGRLGERLDSKVPFTHGAATHHRADDGSGRPVVFEDRHQLAVQDGAKGQLQELVRYLVDEITTALASERRVPWDTMGVYAGEHLGLRARSPEEVASDNPRRLDELVHPGLALRRLVAPRYIQAWRTGRLEYVTELAARIDGLTDRLEVIEELGGEKVKVRAWIDCPVPEDGWGIDDAQWEKLLGALEPTSPKAGRPSTGWAHPLATSRWSDTEHQYAITTRDNGTYRLESRPLDYGQTPDGRDAGWGRYPEVVEHLATVTSAKLDQAVADGLVELASELEGRTAALTVPAPPRQSVVQQRKLDAEIRDLRRQAQEARELANGAHQMMLQKAAAQQHETAADYEQEEADLQKREADLAHRADELEASPPPAEVPDDEEPVRQADLSSLEAVAAALGMTWSPPSEHSRDLVPPEIVTVCRRLFRRTLRFALEPSGTRVRWTVTVNVPLNDGTSGSYEIAGTLPNTRKGRTAHRSPAVVARRYLAEDRCYAAIGEEFGIDGSGGKNTYVVQQIKDWLASGCEVNGTTRSIASADLRRALLDAPIEARRALYAHLTGDTEISEGLPRSFVEHVVAIYTDPQGSWGESWAGADWRLPRAVIDLILAQPDPSAGVGILDATLELDVDYKHLAALTAIRTPKPGVVYPPPSLRRNWERTSRTPVADRRLLAHRCPHPDCAGRGGGMGDQATRQQPVLATQVLWVPEVPDGVLCADCRRMPSRADVRFPASYLRPWRRKIKDVDGTRSGSCIDHYGPPPSETPQAA